MIANALRREARKALTNAARNNGGHSMVRLFFFSPLFLFFVFLGTRDDDIFFLSLFPGSARALLSIDRSMLTRRTMLLSLSLSLFH